MSLDSNEKVYQSDLEHITPSADAQIYGYQGDWILKGLGYEITVAGIEIQPGRALIQGRLYVLNSTKIIPLTAGASGYVGWSVDLTANNVDKGATIDNQQYTFGFFTGAPAGNLMDGDTSATIGLYQITASGTSWGATEMIFPYYETQVITSFPAPSIVTGGTLTVERIGKNLRVDWSSIHVNSWTGASATVIPSGVLKYSLIPSAHRFGGAKQGGVAGAVFGVDYYGRDDASRQGEIRIIQAITFSGNDVFRTNGTHPFTGSFYGTDYLAFKS